MASFTARVAFICLATLVNSQPFQTRITNHPCTPPCPSEKAPGAIFVGAVCVPTLGIKTRRHLLGGYTKWNSQQECWINLTNLIESSTVRAWAQLSMSWDRKQHPFALRYFKTEVDVQNILAAETDPTCSTITTKIVPNVVRSTMTWYPGLAASSTMGISSYRINQINSQDDLLQPKQTFEHRKRNDDVKKEGAMWWTSISSNE